MIDWYSLAANSLWIFAASLAFSVLSIGRWEAANTDQHLWEILKAYRWQLLLHISVVLFLGGMITTSDLLWERILWIMLLTWMLIQTDLLFLFKNRLLSK